MPAERTMSSLVEVGRVGVHRTTRQADRRPDPHAELAKQRSVHVRPARLAGADEFVVDADTAFDGGQLQYREGLFIGPAMPSRACGRRALLGPGQRRLRRGRQVLRSSPPAPRGTAQRGALEFSCRQPASSRGRVDDCLPHGQGARSAPSGHPTLGREQRLFGRTPKSRAADTTPSVFHGPAANK